ncbi:MAG: transglycosylase domain-containing protein [Butyribacter sp.]|uniref:transglycosylase domain-containing protein n=1 Tax=Butyribacter TaxID=2822463 RepID=UPI00383EFDFE|nr:transglycosylase domain-containing protein [Clostridium sp.]MCQ5167451.1 transglycosylase domain-containing protein [Roseburia hominis]
MNTLRRYVKNAKDVFRIIAGVIGSYAGVISNIIGTAMGILASVMVIGGIVGLCVYVKVLPMFTEAREEVFDKLVHLSEDDFVMKEDTVVYDSKGKQVGSVNAGSYKYVKINDVSPYIYEGYIAVEDKRFKTHGGVDLVATMRAGVSLLKHNMEITQGGSTITQQVIKNNLLTQNKSYTRKIAEILLAPTIESKFTKAQIMEFYCNSNFYGNKCYGVGAASKYYFGKKCADLEPHEAAMLIGLSNSPASYNPVLHPKAALKKRNSVLRIMCKEGVITPKEYKSALKKKLNIKQFSEKGGSKESYVMSYAIHCAAISLMEKENFKFQYVFDSKEDYQKYNKQYSKVYSEKIESIRSGGYKLYTSINMKKQKKLQKAVDNGLSFNKEKDGDTGKYALQGAAVCINNETNYVEAIVGGRGKNDQYNRAYLAARQSGSAIKPLIDYTPGFESGMYSPSTIVNDHKFANGPSNAGGGYHGNVRIREAVARSLNTVAWQVLDNITVKYGLSFLDKLHFHNISYIDNDNMALSLGGFTEGVRVVDMAKGFSTLANNGSYSDRTCIKKIEHVSDGVVYKNNNEKDQVYSQDAAWMMTDVLKGVFNESYGTGRKLKLDNGQICAGKTGTTNSSKDVWFCGYTKYYTTVVWAGYDTPRAMPGASGASIPGVIWKDYMDDIHKKLKPEDFIMPSTISLAKYDGNGNIIEGTAISGSSKRTYGMDYFSKTILSEKADEVQVLKDKKYQKEVLKKLKNFEKIYISNIADYYDLENDYKELTDMISSIMDDDVRTDYAVRARNKYDSLKDETVSWKKVVKAYEKQQKEENERLVEKKKNDSERALKNQIYKNKIELARTRIKRMHGYLYQPSNMQILIDSAKEALDACKGYSEYYNLKAMFDMYKKELEELPVKGESNKKNQTPTDTSEPVATEEPQEEE